jgi:hypothetical protein
MPKIRSELWLPTTPFLANFRVAGDPSGTVGALLLFVLIGMSLALQRERISDLRYRFKNPKDGPSVVSKLSYFVPVVG